MAFWNKKKKEKIVEPTPWNSPPPKVCNHAWKDFPWYIEGEYTKYYNGSNYHYTIIEPYVCIYCGERKNVVLEHVERDNISVKEADRLLDTAIDTYKDYLKPKAIVEDMINDFKLVDPQTLYWYEQLHKNPPKKTEFNTPSSIRMSTPTILAE